MSLPRINYTKSWEDPSDFPTVETSEAQVRADLQELPNQIKDQVNAMIVELEASTAAANIGAKDADGNGSTVQDELDRHENEIETLAGAKVRLFTLGSSLSLETAQAVYDFWKSGGLPIIMYNSKPYVYDNKSVSGQQTNLSFYPSARNMSTYNTGAMSQLAMRDLIVVNAQDDVVFSVHTGGIHAMSESFLDPTATYNTPYTPLYPGSPATKKYVDEHLGVKWAEYGVTTVEQIEEWLNGGFDVRLSDNGRIYAINAFFNAGAKTARFKSFDNATEYGVTALAPYAGAATTWSKNEVHYVTR